MRYTSLVCIIVLSGLTSSQQLQFQKEINSIPVYVNDNAIASPFLGGTPNTYPTFVDIDFDGDFDLYVSDSDNNIRLFRNNGSKRNPNFILDATKDLSFTIDSFGYLTFADIDEDGDYELFVSERNGHIYYFKNVGSKMNPQFLLEAKTFSTIPENGHLVSILIDIDDDNDLDVYIGHEKEGLKFYRNSNSNENPSLVLENSQNLPNMIASYPAMTDMDKDGDIDLIIGDSEGRIFFYRNIGSKTNPFFEKESITPIKRGFSCAPTLVDIDDDTDKDLFIGGSYGHISFYRNVGTSSHSSFIREKTIIDSTWFGAGKTRPVFVDIDNDSDADIFVGLNDGSISYIKNTGSASFPNFQLQTHKFDSIDVGTNCSPAFVDIDSDNDLDIVSGVHYGRLQFYANIGTPEKPIFIPKNSSFDSINVGLYSTPTFIDIDNDGDQDLFIGEMDGNLNFYQNTGTPSNPEFSFKTETFGNVTGGIDKLESAPYFSDFDNDKDYDLFVGYFDGVIRCYENVGNSTSPQFTMKSNNFLNINTARRVHPSMHDIDSDEDMDFIIGDSDGQLSLYINNGAANHIEYILETFFVISINLRGLSSPAFYDIDIDGDFDLFIGESSGSINFFRNIGSANEPIFRWETECFVANKIVGHNAPCFVDLDNDNDVDLLVSGSSEVWYYENRGDRKNNNFVQSERLFHFRNNENIGLLRSAASDFDQDGDYDLLIGAGWQMYFCENTGTPNSHRFKSSIGWKWQGTKGCTAPTFTDIDYDHDFDLFVGTDNSLSYFNFDSWYGFELEMVNFLIDPKRNCSAPAFVDIDNDGDPDLFIGELNGGIHFYRNITHREKLLNISKDKINFETVPMESHKVDSVILTNIGSYPLKLLGMHLDSTSDFSLSPTDSFPIILSSHSHKTITLQFTPSSEGEINDTLLILCNDPFRQFAKLPLQGIGKIRTTFHSKNSPLPDSYCLGAIYPNPFNPITTIKYQLPKSNHVNLEIFDILGKLVIILVDEEKRPGFYSAQWNGKDNLGRNVSSGIYFVRITADDFVQTKSLILLR